MFVCLCVCWMSSTLTFFDPLQLALCKYLKRNMLCTSQTLRSYRYSLPRLRCLWSRLSFAWCSRSSSAVTGAVGCEEGRTVTAFHLLRILATAVTDAGGDCHRRQRLLYLKVSTRGEVKKEGGWGGVFEGSVFKQLWTAAVPSTCTHACFCTHTYTHSKTICYILYHYHTPFSAGVLPVLGVASTYFDAVPTLWWRMGAVKRFFARTFQGSHPFTTGCNPQVSKRPT